MACVQGVHGERMSCRCAGGSDVVAMSSVGQPQVFHSSAAMVMPVQPPVSATGSFNTETTTSPSPAAAVAEANQSEPSFISKDARITPVGTYQCIPCGKYFFTPSALRTHSKISKEHRNNVRKNRELLSQKTDTMKRLFCDLCDKTFTSALQWTLHKRSLNHKRRLKERGDTLRAPAAAATRFICGKCGEEFATHQERWTHEQSAHREDLAPSSHENTTTTQEAVPSADDDGALIDDDAPPAPTTSTPALAPSTRSTRLAGRLKTRKVACKLCGQMFTSDKGRTMHEAYFCVLRSRAEDERGVAVSAEKEVDATTCEHCGKHFSTKFAMMGHSSMCPKNPKKKCQQCGATFKSQAKARAHQSKCRAAPALDSQAAGDAGSGKSPQTTPKKRKNECGECGKRFNKPAHLRRHEATHRKTSPRRQSTSTPIERVARQQFEIENENHEPVVSTGNRKKRRSRVKNTNRRDSIANIEVDVKPDISQIQIKTEQADTGYDAWTNPALSPPPRTSGGRSTKKRRSREVSLVIPKLEMSAFIKTEPDDEFSSVYVGSIFKEDVPEVTSSTAAADEAVAAKRQRTSSSAAATTSAASSTSRDEPARKSRRKKKSADDKLVTKWTAPRRTQTSAAPAASASAGGADSSAAILIDSTDEEEVDGSDDNSDTPRRHENTVELTRPLMSNGGQEADSTNSVSVTGIKQEPSASAGEPTEAAVAESEEYREEYTEADAVAEGRGEGEDIPSGDEQAEAEGEEEEERAESVPNPTGYVIPNISSLYSNQDDNTPATSDDVTAASTSVKDEPVTDAAYGRDVTQPRIASGRLSPSTSVSDFEEDDDATTHNDVTTATVQNDEATPAPAAATAEEAAQPEAEVTTEQVAEMSGETDTRADEQPQQEVHTESEPATVKEEVIDDITTEAQKDEEADESVGGEKQTEDAAAVQNENSVAVENQPEVEPEANDPPTTTDDVKTEPLEPLSAVTSQSEQPAAESDAVNTDSNQDMDAPGQQTVDDVTMEVDYAGECTTNMQSFLVQPMTSAVREAMQSSDTSRADENVGSCDARKQNTRTRRVLMRRKARLVRKVDRCRQGKTNKMFKREKSRWRAKHQRHSKRLQRLQQSMCLRKIRIQMEKELLSLLTPSSSSWPS